MPVVAVAYSGGRDSTALLHATSLAAAGLPGVEVVALHVHHGLSVHADAWLAHAEETCRRWAAGGLPVRLLSRRVTVACPKGASVEAEARRARHAALVDMCAEAGTNLLLLAHHRRDQAETFLLQALRGAGVAGLAAMPRDDWRDGVRWVRPWLDRPREAIEGYVAQHQLPFVEDESNADRRWARNRLRLDVWPGLTSAFPDAEAALARAAARTAADLQPVRSWRAEALLRCVRHDGLDAALWAAHDVGARRQLLAAWLKQLGLARGSWVARLSDEVPRALAGQGSARWPELGLCLHRGVLGRLPPGQFGSPKEPAGALAIHGAGEFCLPAWRGRLRVEPVSSGGVSPQRLQAGLEVRPRSGGERFQLGAGRPARDLKRQFQALGVPAWARSAPLFFSAGELLFVPSLGVDARCQAPDGAPQLGLRWLPDA